MVSSIWELETNGSLMVSGQHELKNATYNNFQQVFKDPGNISIVDQLAVFYTFLNFLSKEEGIAVTQLVTLKEILEVLKSFSKDKNIVPDGWTINFFFDFFEVFGLDLLEAVNESRLKGIVMGTLNSMFIAMIPKSDQPTTSNDFCPTSLCNLVNKITTKVITN